LAFHPYPQVIPQVFNPGGFGPPRSLTSASPCPWIDHPASGLGHATKFALFRLGFPTATALALTSPRIANSPAHSSKGTPSQERVPAPTVCKRTVSGAISLPSRGTFHLSLTVLVHYRSLGSSQPYEVGLANSHGIPRAPCYLGTPSGGRSVFVYRAITFFGLTFQRGSTNRRLCNSPTAPVRGLMGPTTPLWQRHRALTPQRFGLIPFRSPLLRDSLLFSLPRGT
jgi:hypothetical protein